MFVVFLPLRALRIHEGHNGISEGLAWEDGIIKIISTLLSRKRERG